MKSRCPFCEEDIKVLVTGRLENHYPSAKITLTPTKFCQGSERIIVPSETFTCPQCGREGVDTDNECKFATHYPLKGWGGAKRACVGSHQKREDLPKEELSYNEKLNPSGSPGYRGVRGITYD